MAVRSTLPGLLLASIVAGQVQLAELGRLDHIVADHDAALATVSVDLDGNRTLDLVVLHDRGLRVYRGDGTGAFAEQPASRIVLARGSPGGMVAGDVDGDGDVDLLYHLWRTNQDTAAKLLLNDGSGGFTDASSQLPSTHRVSALALADVDADGDLDVFVGGGNAASSGPGQPNRLLLNDGKGRFQDAAGFPVDADNTTAATFADVDGDQRLDLILGNTPVYLGPPAQDKLYRGDGKGGFTVVSGLPPDAAAAAAIAAADFDRDGDIDYAVANPAASPVNGQSAVHLYRNDGSGVFAEIPSPTGGAAGTSVHLVDVDGSGTIDLVVGCYARTRRDGGIRVYLGDGSGGFRPGGKGYEDDMLQTTAMAVADFDGDRILDFFAANDRDRNRLFLGLAGGLWLDATAPRRFGLPVATPWPYRFTLVDVDGDGDLDLFEADVRLRLSLNDGDGTFLDVTGTHLPALPGRPTSFAVADCSRDGHPDVLLALEDQATWSLRVLRGSAGGTYTVGAIADLPFTEYLLGVQAGDLDGNGTLDLLLGSYTGPHVYLGDGQGRFAQDARSVFQVARGLNPQLLGDLDGDGDLDVLAKTQNHLPTDEFQIYANDGQGVFAYLRSIKIPFAIVDEFHLVDVDLDGDLDFVVASRPPSLFLNDGKAGFTDVSATRFPIVTPAYSTQRHAWADWDGDGDPDLVLATQVSGETALRYIENVGGAFQDQSTTRLGDAELRFPAAPWLEVVDWDGDGDPDLALVDDTGKRLLQNLRRHTHVPLALRLGADTAVDLFSRSGAAASTHFVMLQVAGASKRYRVEPFGWLRLDLSSLVLLPPLALPAPDGSLRLPLHVPADPGLLGFRLHAQSLVLGPLSTPPQAWRYSNLAIAPPVVQ